PAATYCCYGCLDLGEHEPAVASGGWSPGGLGLRLGVGVLVVGQSMIFGLALNLHDDVPGSVRWAATTIILAATLLVVALLGGPLMRTAWHELCRGRLTIEALFLLTLGGALAASVQAHVTGRGKVYFEVVSILLVVYTLGKAVGARSRAAALAGATAWAGRLRTCRLVAADGRTRTVPVAEVNPGDVIEVHPGEVVAVDGVIRKGVGFLAEAAVTGEPFAVVRRPGDRVLAGVAAFDATFRVEATAPGTDRQVDRLLAAVGEARDRPLSLRRQADRLGRVFLPLVAVAALGTFGYWTFLTPAGWEAGLFNAMSVLLVACPCAIGLATPVVVWSAVSRLAGRGLVVRAGDAVERLAAVDCVLLDKTGTLTEDRFAIVDIETAATGAARAELLGWVSLVEEHSGHPLARPFAELPRPFAAGAGP
ncbi:MAG: HAD-IC family P-type ATPase, partial [Bryobacteraceae bacterium]|nr:HAD-IC family P-type ATPase [Bryobacteraceae bacterium]